MKLIDLDELPESRIEWEDILNAPIVDAKPVKHGYWIPTYRDCRGYTDEFTCSSCSSKIDFWTNTECGYSYCPHCGASMDEEVKQDG